MVRHAVRPFAVLPRPSATDADLLARFARERDEAAFAELVARHGRLVRGVARRVVGHPDPADDVFQATFLLLAGKAGAVRWGPTVGPWLYQAARRIALKARRRFARHRTSPLTDRPAAEAPVAWDDVRAALDAELARLPAALRDPLVLCYLEGLTRDEAAARLGWSVSTLRGRLERGRERLRVRLEARRLTLPAALAAVLLADPPVSAGLATATACAAVEYAATSAAPLAVAGLLAGGWRVKGVLAATLVLAACGAGVVGMAVPSATPKPAAVAEAEAPPEPAPATDAHGDLLPPGAVARLGTVRFRTGSQVFALAFAPDGKRVASWGKALYRHDRFSLWDAVTGEEKRTERTTEDTLAALSWGPSGRGLAVLKAGEVFAGNRVLTTDLRVWEFTAEKPEPLPLPWDNGGPRRFFPAPPGTTLVSFEAAAASADGERLAVATWADGKPGVVTVYPLRPTNALTREKPLASFDPPPIECKALAFTPDGKFLVGAGPDPEREKKEGATVVVWDAKTGKVVRSAEAPDGSVQWREVALAASNDRAAVGLRSGDTFVLDLRAGIGRTVPSGHTEQGWRDGSGVFALAFSPDGSRVVIGGSDMRIRVLDAATGKIIRDFGPVGNWPQAVAFSPDGSRVASGGQDGVVRMWDLTNGKELGPTGSPAGRIWRVSASADGATVLTDADSRELRLWDARTGSPRRTIDTGGTATACRLTPDGKRVVAVVGGHDDPEKVLKVWDAATGADATPPGFPKKLVAGGFQFTPDGATLLTHFEDKLSAWSWPGGEKKWAADMPKPAKELGVNHVNGIAVSPDGRHFVTVAQRSWFRMEKGLKFGSAADGVTDLWETATGNRVRRLAEGTAGRPCAFTPEGLLVHAGGATLPAGAGQAVTTNAVLCVIDPQTGRLVREFAPSGRADGGPNSGHAVVLSADGKVLFRATDGGEVHAFEVATGRYRTAWAGHRDTVTALAAPAADVRRLVSGSCDTTALVWDVGFASVKPAALTAEQRTKAWADLGEGDGETGYRAMRALAGDPTGFVALAAEKLKPAAAGAPAAGLAPVFRDLASPAFAAREAASKTLDGHGEAAAAAVRARLETETSAEVKARLTDFLARHDGPPSDGDKLRRVRAVELLEHLRTPEARALLAELAAGGPSRQTADAASALRRLAGR